MDLSVLIPTYNTRDKVVRCLRSVVNQCTSYSFEVICLDDGSNAFSKRILEEAKEEFFEVKFIQTPHSGVASARNALMKHASGDYVLFVDADDMLTEQAIDVLMNAAVRYHADLVEGAYAFKNGIHMMCDHEIVVYRDEDKLYFSGFLWGKVMRRSLWKNVNFWDGHYYEDLIVHTLIYPLTKICVYTPQICCYYERTDNGLSETLRHSADILDSVKAFSYYLDATEKLLIPVGEYHKAFFQFYSGIVCKRRFQHCLPELKQQVDKGLCQIAKKYWQDEKCNLFSKTNVDNFDIRPPFIAPLVTDKLLFGKTEEWMAVVLATDQSYLPILPVLIRSILLHNYHNVRYDIVIFHDHLKENMYQPVLNEFETEPVSIRFIDIHQWTMHIQFGIKAHHTLNATTYFRLLIPYILSCNYHKALYLDCDMLVNADLYDLYSLSIDEVFLAAVPDITGLSEYYAPSNRKRQYRDKMFGNIAPEDYFNAGLLLLNLDMFRQCVNFSELKEMMEQTCWEQYDQDILNWICGGNTLLLPPEWNVIADFGLNQYLPSKIRTRAFDAECAPKIIHYGGGSRKPWKKENIPYFNEFWSIAEMTSMYDKLTSLLNGVQQESIT